MKSENQTQLADDQTAFDDSLRPDATLPLTAGIFNELGAAIVVACVAIPMGMGIASISGAPPMAGILAGIIGGLVVGLLSGSPTSISGPSAGLTLAIASLMGVLNSFETFLLTVTIAGLLQIVFGIAKLGWLGSKMVSGTRLLKFRSCCGVQQNGSSHLYQTFSGRFGSQAFWVDVESIPSSARKPVLDQEWSKD